MAEIPAPLQALLADPSGASLGLRLPPGEVVATDSGEPVMWLSDEPADADLLDHLWSAAHLNGLVPFVYDGSVIRLDPSTPPDPALTAETVLAGWSNRYRVFEPDHNPALSETSQAEISSVLNFPGSRVAEQDRDRLAAKVAHLIQQDSPFAALAPGARGSDVLSTLGWTGPINYNDPIQSYSVVMRAWEDEFDARVVMLMGDSLGCCVGRPPTTFDRALTLAHQQLAFCPDLAGEFGSVNNHAASLINRTMWHFWWD
ncbi:hypothetical protein GCM10009839_40420 [Catenulispora yoronensis]|uniref:DUF4253 domain-containing protein n=1 Tax=Catenulispora yoronensis TaxID=450799 RepID=A0ABP5FWK0_9ACTN